MSFPRQVRLLNFDEGGVYDTVEKALSRLHGNNYKSILATSRVKKVDYCQSELSDQVAGVPASVASMSTTATEVEIKRLPRKWGAINHDFLVVHLTGSDGKGRELPFCIVAEKVGESLAGEPAGIYIGVMSEAEVAHLHKNVFVSWDCFSVRIPVEVLTRALWEDQDPNYNFLSNNCWDYAQAACTNVMFLLSKQSDATENQKSYFRDRAQEVKTSVVTGAALESGARGAMYVAAAASVFYGIKAAGALYSLVKGRLAGVEEKTKDTESDEKEKVKV